jgi:anthranilate synthase component 1
MMLRRNDPNISSVEVSSLSRNADLLALHALYPERYPHLLESVSYGTAHARFDILFAFPQETLALHSDGSVTGPCALEQDFLTSFDAWWVNDRIAPHESTGLPFSGGWFVFLGYELVQQIEPVLRLPKYGMSLPVAAAVRIPAAIIKDKQTQRLYLVAEQSHNGLIGILREDLESAASCAQEMTYPIVENMNEEVASRYLDAVQRIKRYIVEGDVFQVNLSRRWWGEVASDCSAAQIYHALRNHNPAPFAGLATFGDQAIISSSPERLVKVQNGTAETRPIAGTRPRDKQTQRDVAFSQELIAHPKERAEHIMLIDLERNDLGRIAIPGSVKVNELMVIESFAHVHHIVSNVQGRLVPQVSPEQIIRAMFPGGTITGCPKVRCMEIIAELEQSPRGAYTGAMGYINLDGSMDLNILIRTITQHGTNIELRAGAGIVADSIPQKELEETRAKARGLLLALGACRI